LNPKLDQQVESLEERLSDLEYRMLDMVKQAESPTK
jgi:hypothetical protein